MASEYFQAASWDREVLWQIYKLNNTQPQIPSDDEASRQMYGLSNYEEASRQMYALNDYPTQPQIPSDDDASRQMYGLNDYPTQPQIPSDDEASRQMYGLSNFEKASRQMYALNYYPTRPQIPSDDDASRQMYGLNDYPTQPQRPSDDEASPQMYGLNNYPTQPQVTCDEEPSRQMPEVQPIFALPNARPQRIQQPALGRKLPPLTPKHPLLRRGRKGKPKPRKYLTDEERQEICQIHEDNPSATKAGTGDRFNVDRSTISKILKNKERYLQHGGASHPSAKYAERKPPNIGRKLTGSAPLRPKLPSLGRNGKQLRRTLTDEQKREICQIHEDFPSRKKRETAKDFGFERSTISKVLKNKEIYLKHGGASHHSDAERNPTSIRRALEIWAVRAETLGIKLTGSAIEERARTFASVGNEESFLQSAEFEEFKQRRRVDGLPSPPSSKILNKGELGVYINQAAPLSGLGRGVSSVLPPTQDEARDALKTLLLFSRESVGILDNTESACILKLLGRLQRSANTHIED